MVGVNHLGCCFFLTKKCCTNVSIAVWRIYSVFNIAQTSSTSLRWYSIRENCDSLMNYTYLPNQLLSNHRRLSIPQWELMLEHRKVIRWEDFRMSIRYFWLVDEKTIFRMLPLMRVGLSTGCSKISSKINYRIDRKSLYDFGGSFPNQHQVNWGLLVLANDHLA